MSMGERKAETVCLLDMQVAVILGERRIMLI